MPTEGQHNLSKAKKRRPNNGRKGARHARNKKIVDSYPDCTVEDYVALMESEQCAKCEINVGRIALLPCGHAKYCGKCVNDRKTKSLKSMYPMRCLCKTCLSIVTSWFVLNKILSKT